MDTLPYWEFESKNYPECLGKSYFHQGARMLVSRKYAMLAGLHEKGFSHDQLVKEGKKLFEAEYVLPTEIPDR